MMLAFREQGVLVVLVLHSAQSGGDLYRAKTLRMSAELVFSWGHKPALRYSLISPWTTCLSPDPGSLICRGTVYLLVGYRALRLALATHGRSGAPASSAGAVQEAVAPAWGRVPLVLLVAGLGAYALTQLIEAVFRPSHATGTMGRWRQRAVSWWGCLLYSAFCLSTARLLVEIPPKQTAESEQRQDTDVTAVLLRTGWGRLLLVVVGVLVVVAGVEMAARSQQAPSTSRPCATPSPAVRMCCRQDRRSLLL